MHINSKSDVIKKSAKHFQQHFIICSLACVYLQCLLLCLCYTEVGEVGTWLLGKPAVPGLAAAKRTEAKLSVSLGVDLQINDALHN